MELNLSFSIEFNQMIGNICFTFVKQPGTPTKNMIVFKNRCANNNFMFVGFSVCLLFVYDSLNCQNIDTCT